MHLKLPSPFTTASKGRISASAFAIVPPPYTKDKYGNELNDIVEDDAKNEDSNDGVGQFDDAFESEDEEDDDEVELELEFPSLLAASTVPYEGEDNANDNNDTTKANLEVVNEVVEEKEKKTVF